MWVVAFVSTVADELVEALSEELESVLREHVGRQENFVVGRGARSPSISMSTFSL